MMWGEKILSIIKKKKRTMLNLKPLKLVRDDIEFEFYKKE
jgi:uncharacterized protein YpmS